MYYVYAIQRTILILVRSIGAAIYNGAVACMSDTVVYCYNTSICY